MSKNPKKLSKSLSAQYYNIAQQFTLMYVCYVHIYVCTYVCIIFHDKIRCFCEYSKDDGYNKNKCIKIRNKNLHY